MSLRAVDDVPDVVREWVRQLLSPETSAILAAADGRQVEVRLYCNGDRVRKRPAIVIDGGPQDMVSAG